MNELSLFTGAGGGILGTHLLGWTPIGYVEWDDYCQRVIAARIRDGFIPAAPIFGDVREFAQSGAAEQYRGFADVVTAGFPCQPFSVAGEQNAANDERNMWPATADVIRAIRPRHALLENVTALIASGYFGTILADLADMGYVGRWGCVSAGDCGAPHERDRLWIIAHANEVVGPSWPCSLKQHGSSAIQQDNSRNVAFNRFGSWVEMAAEFRRMDDGLASAVERTEAVGNGQVPAVVAAAWRLLA
jgi:DNA (cytosine-5)-methyltransferase 1